MTSKSIKKQILEKTLDAKYDLERSFENYATKKIDFDEFMEVVEECGDRLSRAYDAYLLDQKTEAEEEGDPMAYEDWREREDEEERERMIEYIKEEREELSDV